VSDADVSDAESSGAGFAASDASDADAPEGG